MSLVECGLSPIVGLVESYSLGPGPGLGPNTVPSVRSKLTQEAESATLGLSPNIGSEPIQPVEPNQFDRVRSFFSFIYLYIHKIIYIIHNHLYK